MLNLKGYTVKGTDLRSREPFEELFILNDDGSWMPENVVEEHYAALGCKAEEVIPDGNKLGYEIEIDLIEEYLKAKRAVASN